MKPILEISKISKRYRIGQQRLSYFSLRDKLAGLLRPGDQMEDFWALRDVTFEVQEGESIGIIGKNGAGKSTLLKILSRITPPTAGRIISRGRIASLLEVGTGFHQELTGRENIFMNGSILGMKRSEILRRFDEIVSFSGTEKFLDTQLKHYSSGMQLRLAFAVAAHLDPEILIIDEVLAVGDAEFQKKCLRKMEDVSGQGRTLLFVSHNLPSLRSICRKGFLLQNGSVVKSGNIEDVIDHYSNSNQTGAEILDNVYYHHSYLKIHAIKINDDANNTIALEKSTLKIQIDIEFFQKTTFELDVHLKKEENLIASFANFVKDDVRSFETGRYCITYNVELPDLRSGSYKLDLFFTEPFICWLAVCENAATINVLNSDHHTFLNTGSLKWGSILLKGNYKVDN